MIKYNEAFAIPYLSFVFVFALYMLYSLISQIYAESLRKVVIKYGYPEDKEQISWTYKDYLSWIFVCFRNNFEDLDKDEEVKKGEVEKIDIDQKEV